MMKPLKHNNDFLVLLVIVIVIVLILIAAIAEGSNSPDDFRNKFFTGVVVYKFHRPLLEVQLLTGSIFQLEAPGGVFDEVAIGDCFHVLDLVINTDPASCQPSDPYDLCIKRCESAFP
jgi:hypothetical protein